MEPSPLTQQQRPSTFQPKIGQLYEDLFQQEDQDLAESDGFWREFFLLRPDRERLQQRLERLYPSDLINSQYESQQLFHQAVVRMKAEKAPMDEHALETLTVFLIVILDKRYMNPSADVITVLAGLDEIDTVFIDFASAVETLISSGRTGSLRLKAIDATLALVSGAYQTSLISYFTQRDLFPALIKYVQDDENAEETSKAFLLLCLLANYNKFEFRNPYRVRLEDLINESTIQHILEGLGESLARSRDQYVAVQEDIAVGWTLSSTLSYIGLGILAPIKPMTPTTNSAKDDFADLPGPSVALLLGIYDFSSANKVFCHSLVSCMTGGKLGEAPFGAFLSFTSYLLHHAYRSPRATTYGLLNLLVLRIVMEESSLCKVLCDSEVSLSVRLCRQRQPFLPATPKSRPSIASILDITVDAINHNLRRHLDLRLYVSIFRLLHRILSYLAFTRTRLVYHWPLLWQTLVSFLRFLTTYAPSFASHEPDIPRLLKPFIATLALAVISGESFLPDPASHDDLFYKLVEAGDFLTRFKNAFADRLPVPDDGVGLRGSGPTTPTMDVLIQVSAHYHDLVQEERGRGRLGNNPSPREVSKIIRQGYETLNLTPIDGLDRWDRYREGEERGLLKRAARLAVEDTKRLLRNE